MKKEIYLPVDNLYVRSLLDIFNEYIIRDLGYGVLYPEYFLAPRIKAAIDLHSKERKEALSGTKIYGANNLDGSNTEIVFVNKNGDRINRIDTLKNYV